MSKANNKPLTAPLRHALHRGPQRDMRAMARRLAQPIDHIASSHHAAKSCHTASHGTASYCTRSEHNAALAGPGQTAHTPNWAMTQWAGLVQSCIAFPELVNASHLLQLALSKLEGWMDEEVYPDGVETSV